MKKIIKSGLTVFIIATIGALLLAWVYSFTNPKIEEQKFLSIKNAIEEIFPNQIGFDEMPEFKNKIIENNINIITVYKVKFENGEFGFVVRAIYSGYGGKVESLFGYQDKKSKGVYVLEHSETPGLGSLITSKDFTKQFINKNLSDPFIPKQDVQAITGATISSKTISNAIKTIGKFYLDNIYGGKK
ncbi:MAG: FMN-binding protein [Caldisericia bacterium]